MREFDGTCGKTCRFCISHDIIPLLHCDLKPMRGVRNPGHKCDHKDERLNALKAQLGDEFVVVRREDIIATMDTIPTNMGAFISGFGFGRRCAYCGQSGRYDDEIQHDTDCKWARLKSALDKTADISTVESSVNERDILVDKAADKTSTNNREEH